MKKSFRFVSIILAFTLLLVVGITPAFADSASISVRDENRARLLAALGVDVPVGTTPLTRGDFSLYIAKATGMDELPFNGRLPYQDVTLDAPYYNCVGVLYQLGVLSDSDSFNPAVAITPSEAAKIIVSTLGYDLMAQAQGGYPYGYIVCAQSLGITLPGESITADSMTNILFEMLEAKPNRPLTINQSIDSLTKDGFSLYHNVTPVTDIITANAVSSIFEDGRKVGKGSISLGGITYAVPDSLTDGVHSISTYLGCRINAYIYDEAGENAEIIYFDTQDIDIVTLNASDVVSYRDFNLEYDNGTRTDDYAIARSFSMVWNGKLRADFTDADFRFSDGTILLFDNNSDGYYDVVNIEKPEYILTNGISLTYMSIADRNKAKYGPNNESVIYFDDTNAIYEYFIHSDGKLTACTLDELEGYETLALVMSRDGNFIRLTGFDYTRNALLSEYSTEGNGYVTLDGTQYEKTEYANTYCTDLQTGVRVKAYLTPDNKLLYIRSTEDDMRYGYLMKVDQASTFDGYAAAMLQENGVKGYLYFKDNLILDGRSVPVDFNDSSNEVYIKLYKQPQLVKYSLDSNGKLACIDTGKATTELYVPNQNPKDCLFDYTESFRNADTGKYTVLRRTVDYTQCLTPGIIPRQALIFSVPKALLDEPAAYEFNAKDFDLIPIEEFPTSNTDVRVYDLAENRDAGAIVMYNPSTSGSLPTTNEYSTRAAIDRIVNAINDEGSPVKKVTYVTLQSLGTPSFSTAYFTEELQEYYTQQGYNIEPGDVVTLTLSGKTITNIVPDFDYNQWSLASGLPQDYEDYANINFYGKGTIVSLVDSSVSVMLDDGSILAYPLRNVTNLLRFNAQKQSFEVISADDLKTIYSTDKENANRVVYRSRSASLNFIAIYPSVNEQ